MVFGRQRLTHRQRHQQFLCQLLLAKSDRSAGHHNTFAALQMALGHLFDNRCQSTQRQAIVVLTCDDRTAQFDNQTTCVLQLAAIREGLLLLFAQWSIAFVLVQLEKEAAKNKRLK